MYRPTWNISEQKDAQTDQIFTVRTCPTLKEINSQSDYYLVSLTSYFFLCNVIFHVTPGAKVNDRTCSKCSR